MSPMSIKYILSESMLPVGILAKEKSGSGSPEWMEFGLQREI